MHGVVQQAGKRSRHHVLYKQAGRQVKAGLRDAEAGRVRCRQTQAGPEVEVQERGEAVRPMQ
jgi:hypothetical protein